MADTFVDKLINAKALVTEALTPNCLRNENDVLDPRSTRKRKRDKSPVRVPLEDPDFEKIDTLCFAPYELYGLDISIGFGLLVEPFIGYKLKEVYDQLVPPITTDDRYIDSFLAGSIDQKYVDFLKKKNPQLPPQTIEAIEKAQKQRPDLMLDNGVIKEYYEIKPNSKKGIEAGRAKLRGIATYCAGFGLPYTAGTALDPFFPMMIEICDIEVTIDGYKIPVKAHFEVQCKEGGLLLYRLCIETKWELVYALGFTLAVLEYLLDYIRKVIASVKQLVEEAKDVAVAFIYDWIKFQVIVGLSFAAALALVFVLIAVAESAVVGVAVAAAAAVGIGLRNLLKNDLEAIDTTIAEAIIAKRAGSMKNSIGSTMET